MNTMILILTIFGLFYVHSKLQHLANHRHELRTADARERILRWFIVVGAAWAVTYLLLLGLSIIDFADAFTVHPPEAKHN